MTATPVTTQATNSIPAASKAALFTASGVCALIVLDTNIVAVALPTIGRDLVASFSQIEWIVGSYMLTLAAGLLPSGSLADRYGRKRMMFWGLLLFVAASLACGAAPTIVALNMARAAKGMGAALLLTSALASIAHAFHEPRARAKAWAFWGSCMGIAMLVAPALGGVISEFMGWRWVFFLNLPVCASLAMMVRRHIPESRNPQPASLDVAGGLCFFASLFFLISAFIDANDEGWLSASTAGRLAAGAVLLAVFAIIERVRPQPMVDLALFASRRFLGALLAMAGYAACAQVMMTLLPLYLQTSLGFTAVTSGLAMLPFAIAMLISPRVAVHLSDRWQPASVLTLGLLLVGAGNLASAWAVTLHDYLPFACAIALTGTGAGILNGDTQKNIVAAAPRERSGMASGISTTVRFSTIVMSVGLLGGLLSHRVSATLALTLPADGGTPALGPEAIARAIAGDIGAALSYAPAAARAALKPLLQNAYTQGFSTMLVAAGVASLVAALLVKRLMRPV